MGLLVWKKYMERQGHIDEEFEVNEKEVFQGFLNQESTPVIVQKVVEEQKKVEEGFYNEEDSDNDSDFEVKYAQ